MSENQSYPKPAGFKTTTGWHDFVAGTSAGIIGTVFGHPLDTVKVRLQAQSTAIYSGMIDCFIKMISSLFRGIASPMVNLTILNSLSFGTYGKMKSLIRTELNDGRPLEHHHHVLAGSVVGALSTLVSTPFEMLVRLQLDNVKGKQFRGSMHATRFLIREYGVACLYSGFWVNLWREIAFCALYFGVYEAGKSSLQQLFLQHTGSQKDVLSILIAGGFAGMAGWFGSFPLDTCKSIIQGQELTKPFKQRLRMHNVAISQFRSKGLLGLYSGVGPALARAFIVSGTRFSAYEFVLQSLAQLDRR